MTDSEKKKPNRRSPNSALTIKRPIDWKEAKVEPIEEQHWHKPVNPFLKSIA